MTYRIESNQYIPYKPKSLPSGMPKCETYYYIVNQDNKVINKHTLKTYRGKEMNNYSFSTKEGAETLLERLNNLVKQN